MFPFSYCRKIPDYPFPFNCYVMFNNSVHVCRFSPILIGSPHVQLSWLPVPKCRQSVKIRRSCFVRKGRMLWNGLAMLQPCPSRLPPPSPLSGGRDESPPTWILSVRLALEYGRCRSVCSIQNEFNEYLFAVYFVDRNNDIKGWLNVVSHHIQSKRPIDSLCTSQ